MIEICGVTPACRKLSKLLYPCENLLRLVWKRSRTFPDGSSARSRWVNNARWASHARWTRSL